ncbi:peptidase inhibitor family I36 protein [Streptomyces sp. NPDC048155]
MATCMVGAASAGLLTSTAHASSPTTDCREALNDIEESSGICFWSEQDFRGTLSVRANPAGTETCGNLNPPAKSAVNLTDHDRFLYQFKNCKEGNFETVIEPYEAVSEIGLNASAGSWR